MVDPDKLEEELEEHGEHIEALIQRSSEQVVDIKELKEEVQALKEDIDASEDVEETDSGVAQS